MSVDAPPDLRFFTAVDADLLAFIDAIPKTECHLHIDGAIPWRAYRTAMQDPAERPPFWDPAYRFADFAAFCDVVDAYAAPWLDSLDRCADSTELMLRDCAAQNVRYVETSIDFYAASRIGDPREVIDAMRAGADRLPAIEVRLFVGISRDAYRDHAPMIDALVAHPALDGVDLHGFETLALEPWTDAVWHHARAQGKLTKAHAGEFGPAASVHRTVERLGVRRIEHGVRAIEDPATVALLIERGVTLDVCPISNLKLQVVPSLAAHPIAALHRAGVACTINTDDPFTFGSTLREEYAALVLYAGLSRDDLLTLAANGFRAAACSERLRTQSLAAIAALTAG